MYNLTSKSYSAFSLKLLTTIFLISSTSLALADDVISPINNNYYANANLGMGVPQNLPAGRFTGAINAGYNINQIFAVELGYVLMTGSEYGAMTSSNIFDVATRASLALSQEYSVYGRVGVGFGINGSRGSVSDGVINCPLCSGANQSDYGLAIVGLGATHKISDVVTLRLEDTQYEPWVNTSSKATNAVTLGAEYSF